MMKATRKKDRKENEAAWNTKDEREQDSEKKEIVRQTILQKEKSYA